MVNQGHFEIALYDWTGDFMDPVSYLSMWTTDNGNNSAQWSNQEYDRLIRLSGRIADQKTRLDVLHQAEALLLQEMSITPLYWDTKCYLIDPSVQGWNPVALDLHNYKFVDLSMEELAR